MPSKKKGILALEDGTVYHGIAFGASKTVLGEAVFNTAMTGYQEILTDPSYYKQIVVMTAPMIGNYGVCPQDNESDGPKISAFVIRELSPVASNWRSRQSLNEYLQTEGIPGLEDIDTRSLTQKLRLAGSLNACLSTEDISDEEAIRRARAWTGLVGVDSVKDVTTHLPYTFQMDTLNYPFTVEGTTLYKETPKTTKYKVVAFDFGAKKSIFRQLVRYGFEVTVVPAHTTAQQVKELCPDGVFLSNGPGDPAAITYAHATVRDLLGSYPIFGICMGHQVICHALGASTYKLKFGHHGANHPVKNLETGKVSITSQNHGFASRQDEIENHGGIVTEINLNDNTIEGLRHKDYPLFSVQYHPEAAPGPNDASPLFEDFYQLITKHKG